MEHSENICRDRHQLWRERLDDLKTSGLTQKAWRQAQHISQSTLRYWIRKKVKILHWDQDGFILYYKRREKGHFAWPDQFREGKVNEVSRRDLQRFLQGLVMESYIPKPSFLVT